MKRLSVLWIATISFFVFVSFTSCKKGDADTSSIVITEGTPVTDYDGNSYKTIKIGTQTWMAENLKSTHYSDGSPIASFSYGNNDANVLVYGRLYTWSVTMRAAPSSISNPSSVQGIAPAGWHIPSSAEWQQLIDYLGGVSVAGGKIKEVGISNWTSPNEGATNESKLNALPAGMYAFWNEFQWKGDHCAFATTTDASVPGHPACIAVKLDYNSTLATISQFHPDDAISVRCVKD